MQRQFAYVFFIFLILSAFVCHMLILKCEKAVLGVYRASKAAWHYKCQYIASAAESVFSSKFAGFNYIRFIWSHNSRLIQVFDDEMQKMKVTLHYITIAVSLNALYVTSALRDLMTWNHRTQVYFYGWTDTVLFASWLVTTSILFLWISARSYRHRWPVERHCYLG